MDKRSTTLNQQIKPVPGGRSLLVAIVQALVVLALAVGVAQGLVLSHIQDRLFGAFQRWEVEYLNGGTIDLLAAELNAVPINETQRRLDELSPRFGFDVFLLPFSDIEETRLDSASLTRLRDFEVVGDPADYSTFKLLEDRKRVLVFSNTKVPGAHLITEAQRLSMGTIAMLEVTLEKTPRDKWQTAIAAKAPAFKYPVALLPVGDLDLGSRQLSDLNDGQIVTIATDDSVTADYPAEWAYKKVGDSVLAIGPFSPPTLKRFYKVIPIYYLVLGVIVLIPLVLFLAPTWRSMNQLSTATAAFGQGDFAVRARTIRGSKTNYLVNVFNQMAGKIQSLIESNKALINAVSHELRTPISRIEFNIELARQSTDVDERNRQLGRIEDSVDELKTMVSEMLQYARFDREKPSFTMESVSIGEWLHSESKNWQADEIDKDLNIQIVLPDAPIQIPIERYYMSRAISNLVRNATRFAKSTIVVEAKMINGSCEICVSDDGPGVEYQERTKIFEPFVRLEKSRNRESGGTGLGLAIVRQIVAWHAGEVWVEESPSGGAKFVVQWPREEKA